MKWLSKIFKLPIILTIGMLKILFFYIGPGVGLSALGAILAVIGGVAATCFGLIWYPLKRLLGKKKESQEPDPIPDEEE